VETRPCSLFGDDGQAVVNKCKRDNIVGASETDWMEWQAGYVCGAILMPAGPLINTVQAFRKESGLVLSNLALNSDAGQRLIETVAATFQTSRDAARGTDDLSNLQPLQWENNRGKGDTWPQQWVCAVMAKN
jgi:hypothetical protein